MNFSLKKLFLYMLAAAILFQAYRISYRKYLQETKPYLCFRVKFDTHMKDRPVPLGSDYVAQSSQLGPSEYNEIKTYEGWLVIAYSDPHDIGVDRPPQWVCHYVCFEKPEEAVAVSRQELKDLFGIEEIPAANGFMNIRRPNGSEYKKYSYYARFPDDLHIWTEDWWPEIKVSPPLCTPF